MEAIKNDIAEKFQKEVQENANESVAVIGMKILIDLLKHNQQITTVQGLHDNLRSAIKQMYDTDDADAALNSGCELLMRFITLTSMDQNNFEECRRVLVERAEIFLDYVSKARVAIAHNVGEFLSAARLTCLVYRHSRVVVQSLIALHQAGRLVQCFVVGDNAAHDKVKQALFECTVSEPKMVVHCIPEAAISLFLGEVDCVLLGAEAFCQSGGIVNSVGSRNIALLAKHFNKPVYALLEFFKFSRESPLCTEELPLNYLYRASSVKNWREKLGEEITDEQLKATLRINETPRVDYTEHELIKTIIYDQGIIPPEVATVEIIKLYV